jgi:PAS domain S-box-containing protein
VAWQEERNFVSAVLDTASAVVMILDSTGNILRMNRACERISGVTEKDVAGQCFWDMFLVPGEVENVRNIFKRLLAGQFPANYESSWVAKDGTRRAIAWSNTVLTRREKDMQHVIATGVDITPRKEAEEKLQEAIGDLARTNRDLDKYSAELVEANRRLKKLDELKSHFISAASHELKTPLTSLKGYVEMVLNGEAGPINDEQKEYLTYVKESTDRLYRLLRDLLDISKIESGQVKMHRDPTDLRSLIKDEISLFKGQARDKETGLSMEVDPLLNNVVCDADKIREVLDNLLSNAIKYTPARGQVKITARNADGGGVLIEVRDNGIGIKKEDQLRIFDPFQRIPKPAMETDEESTGLGLTLVKRIVEAHGGEIRVQSEEGKGTLFTVLLPHDFKQEDLNELVEHRL